MCWVFPSCVWAKQAVLNELLQLDNQIMFTYGEVQISAKNHRLGVQAECGQQHQRIRLSGGLPSKDVDCETAPLFSETLTTYFITLALLKSKLNKRHRSYIAQTSSTIKDKRRHVITGHITPKNCILYKCRALTHFVNRCC